MEISGSKEAIHKARALRKAMTKPERLLWWALRKHRSELHFRKQHPAGPYILDFYCDAARLCVEVDGEHHDLTHLHDVSRDAWLGERGVRTLRIPASQVTGNLEGVVQHIVTVARGRR